MTIPIFPLNLVVFPKSRYPLHIFEERYKKMINRCIAENAGFGIISKVENELSMVGSFVIISNVLKKSDTGEMDIVVIGVGRFIVKDIKIHPDGYNVAEIDEYNDVPERVDEELLYEMQTMFEGIIDKIQFHLEDSFWTNYFNASSKSFKLAEKSGLSLKQQLELLTLQNENERIYYLISHYTNLNKQISENSLANSIIMGDGYINDEIL